MIFSILFLLLKGYLWLLVRYCCVVFFRALDPLVDTQAIFTPHQTWMRVTDFKVIKSRMSMSDKSQLHSFLVSALGLPERYLIRSIYFQYYHTRSAIHKFVPDGLLRYVHGEIINWFKSIFSLPFIRIWEHQSEYV